MVAKKFVEMNARLREMRRPRVVGHPATVQRHTITDVADTRLGGGHPEQDVRGEGEGEGDGLTLRSHASPKGPLTCFGSTGGVRTMGRWCKDEHVPIQRATPRVS